MYKSGWMQVEVVLTEIRDILIRGILIVYSGDNEIHSPKYHLISGDLRQMEMTGSKILSSGVHMRWV